MYKHTNPTQGTFTLDDSKGNKFVLKPGQSVTLDVCRESNGIIVEEIKNSKKTKQFEGDE